jgi:hypothetical protein
MTRIEDGRLCYFPSRDTTARREASPKAFAGRSAIAGSALYPRKVVAARERVAPERLDARLRAGSA